MICVWIAAIALSSGMLDVLDEHEGPWVAEGWEITEEVTIDPADYFDDLEFPLEHRLSCSTAFVFEESRPRWRIVLSYDGKHVFLHEGQDVPQVYHLEGGDVSTSENCGFAIVRKRHTLLCEPPDEPIKWFFIDSRDSTVEELNVPERMTRSPSHSIVILANDGAFIVATKAGPTKEAVFLTSSDSGLDEVVGQAPRSLINWDYTSEGALVAAVVVTESGRRIAGFDWSMDERWSVDGGASRSPGGNQFCVSRNGEIVASEIFNELIYGDGFTVLEGSTGSVLGRFLEGTSVASLAVSADGSIVVATSARSQSVEGDSRTISGHVSGTPSSWHSLGKSEITIFLPFESHAPSTLECYSARYGYAEAIGVESDGAILVRLRDRLMYIENEGPPSNRMLALVTLDGQLVWASAPRLRGIHHRSSFSYRTDFSPRARSPITRFCSTDTGYRVIYESNDGRALKIVTIERTA
ncbi:hypothetical protein GF402_11865 [Candidatus Fermentibacteria bacterium]|nr:hypothetical protein [Candidatus Fermentibacteria bacterium]